MSLWPGRGRASQSNSDAAQQRAGSEFHAGRGVIVTPEFPDPQTLRAVLAMATQAPSVHNSQPWHWRVGARSLHLYADPGRLPGTDSDRPSLLVSCGSSLHHCAVALAAMGWRPTVRRLPDPADPAHLADLTVEPQTPDELDVTLAVAVGRCRVERRSFGPWPVPWGDIARMGARAARAGVMLRQIDPIPRPPEEPPPATPDNGVALALGTDSDDGLARLRAGEATSLVLLSATAMGLVGYPVAEPLDIPETRRAVGADVFGADGFPQMLMRVGWPPVPSPQSKRIDVPGFSVSTRPRHSMTTGG